MGPGRDHPGRTPLPGGRAPRGHRGADPPDPHPGERELTGVRHLALVGCTASGKSAVALDVAERLGDVELVTADSMQVYRGMDIGTAKPGSGERARVPHHLLDVADPGDDWSVTAWTAAARAALAGIEARGHRALLVGGTGLYADALVDGWTPPGRWPDVAADLEAEADRVGSAALHRRLAELDRRAAERMEPGNRRRVIRALEVTIGSGRPFSSYGPGVDAHPPTRWRLAGLWLPRPVVARRIAERFAAMLDAGLVAETARLAAAGMGRTARQALGYREVLAHLEGGLALEDAADLAVRRTRAFARRQRMWWRRDPRICWIGSAAKPLAASDVLLRDWGRP